jgi:hypothetical protein
MPAGMYNPVGMPVGTGDVQNNVYAAYPYPPIVYSNGQQSWVYPQAAQQQAAGSTTSVSPQPSPTSPVPYQYTTGYPQQQLQLQQQLSPQPLQHQLPPQQVQLQQQLPPTHNNQTPQQQQQQYVGGGPGLLSNPAGVTQTISPLVGGNGGYSVSDQQTGVTSSPAEPNDSPNISTTAQLAQLNIAAGQGRHQGTVRW